MHTFGPSTPAYKPQRAAAAIRRANVRGGRLRTAAIRHELRAAAAALGQAAVATTKCKRRRGVGRGAGAQEASKT